MELDSKLGVCIKDQESVVAYQNESCMKLCGDQRQKKCQEACMKNYHLEAPLIVNQGMKLIKNSETPHGRADAVIINDGKTIITLLYDLDEKFKNIEESLEEIKRCDLTNSEMTVMELILYGLSKREMKMKLFVSDATIKTHLNNIYKKLPLKWQILKKRQI